MATNTQFSIAVHVMAGLGARALSGVGAPSGALAQSVNACPSFVRRVLAKLSKAGLLRTSTGKGGFCALARPAASISLLDIYKAVEAPKAFAIHDYPEQKSCAISCGIKSSMQKVLDRTQSSMEASLRKTSLADVLADVTD